MQQALCPGPGTISLRSSLSAAEEWASGRGAGILRGVRIQASWTFVLLPNTGGVR